MYALLSHKIQAEKQAPTSHGVKKPIYVVGRRFFFLSPAKADSRSSFTRLLEEGTNEEP